MPAHMNGATLIGSNFKAPTKGQPAPLPPSQPLCESEICPVKAPHVHRSYVRTTQGVPAVIAKMEAKPKKNGYDIAFLDKFYSVHWDHVNRPLPTPVKECVDQTCPLYNEHCCAVDHPSRHAAKVFSTNPQKAHLLPIKIQELHAKVNKTWRDIKDLNDFWKIHGPVKKHTKVDEEPTKGRKEPTMVAKEPTKGAWAQANAGVWAEGKGSALFGDIPK